MYHTEYCMFFKYHTLLIAIDCYSLCKWRHFGGTKYCIYDTLCVKLLNYARTSSGSVLKWNLITDINPCGLQTQWCILWSHSLGFVWVPLFPNCLHLSAPHPLLYLTDRLASAPPSITAHFPSVQDVLAPVRDSGVWCVWLWHTSQGNGISSLPG